MLQSPRKFEPRGRVLRSCKSLERVIPRKFPSEQNYRTPTPLTFSDRSLKAAMS
jgi:hypothetical protein